MHIFARCPETRLQLKDNIALCLLDVLTGKCLLTGPLYQLYMVIKCQECVFKWPKKDDAGFKENSNRAVPQNEQTCTH